LLDADKVAKKGPTGMVHREMMSQKSAGCISPEDKPTKKDLEGWYIY